MAMMLALLLTAALTGAAQEGADATPRAVYGVGQIRIHDRELYREYERAFAAIFQRYGGEIVAASESPVIVEGEWPWTRTVLLRFPSKEAFDRWYRSPEYQEIAKTRWAAATANLILVEARP